MTAKNKEAEKAVMRARAALVVSQPFYGCLALHLQTVERANDPSCPTAAVDGRHLFYNPMWWLSLGEQEQIGVMAHEVSHCVYQHFGRRGNRHHIIWNMAGDYRINADLLEAGFTLPKQRRHDEKYKTLSTEEIYEDLMKNVTIIELSMGNGDGKNPDPGGCGGVMDAAPKTDKATQDRVTNEWEGNIRMAVAVAKRNNAGKLPGHLERLVTQLEQPRVDWREQTHQWIDAVMASDYSWQHPNRRYLAMDVIAPGLRAVETIAQLVVFVDISGSISDRMTRAYVSEAGGALDTGVAQQIIVAYIDTRVQTHDVFEHGDTVSARTVGGGGTDFDHAFVWLKENFPDCTGVIFLTDMHTCSFGEEPHCPVLWASSTPEGSHPKNPFGDVIYIDGIDE